ncbi:MAG: response regulator transcription factor [Lachnospiraceae bacterium]|nr:response regulator transcription factor [Lachnospiraceae bacterium]
MKVVIIDDDSLVCMSLKIILEAEGSIEVVGSGNDGSQAMALYEEHRPDVMLMDIRMQGMTGIEALEGLREKYPEAKVLFLTTFMDDEYIVKAIRLGARGYIIKQSFEKIVPALNAVNSGQIVYGEEIISKIPDIINVKDEPDFSEYGISEKEFDIIRLIAEGLSNKEIATELYLSEGTVRNYLSIILEKLNLRDRTQLAIFYYKNKK